MNKTLSSVLTCAILLLIASPSTAQNDAKLFVKAPLTRLTLKELKVEGAKRSSYLKRQWQTPSKKKPTANLAEFRKHIRPVLKKTCVRCHGPKKKEGNIRIDNLDPNLVTGKDVSWWLEIAAVLTNGEMPPADAAKLADKDRARIINWLSAEIQTASIIRRAGQGHSSFRRMTRYEYTYALQDLLGLPFSFGKDLPPESNAEDGFKNSAAMLHMTASQFRTYRELSRKALQRATVRGKRPAEIYWAVRMKAASGKLFARQEAELEKIRKKHKKDPKKAKQLVARRRRRYQARQGRAHYKNLKTKHAANAGWSYYGAKYAWKPTAKKPKVPPKSDYVAVIPTAQRLIVELGNRVPDEGLLRVRVRASRTSAKQHPSLQLRFGWQASNDSQADVRVSERDIAIDAPPGKPRFYQFEVPLSEIYPRNSVRRTAKMGATPNPSELLKLVNTSASPADIQIDYVEVTAPVYKQWPPKSHRRVFIDSKNRENEKVYAKEVLTLFMTRAWRRPVTTAEVNQKLKLFTRIRPVCDDFQQAVVEVLATVISSPKFLYLVRTDQPKTEGKGNRLSDIDLASRLAMFLWSSVPDEQLRSLAVQGKLNQPAELQRQVQRMLKDGRSNRFSKHFVRQWLGMQLLDFLRIDRKRHRRFNPRLKESMKQEPIAFFKEVLKHNHSVLDFIHSDYTMANERLARHYGLPRIRGNELRRVALRPQDRRGGVLTQAGLLAMNSDGSDSHPLKRGIWMLKNLLDDPPPPPPPAVPEIDLADPKIAKLTLKQRIENHRNHAACMSCHAKIDPWGIAFENFDATGKWRTQVKGKKVDATSLLFNKEKLDGMEGLKRYLLSNRQDQFVRAMVQKMTTYALGRPLTFGDRSRVDQIAADLRRKGDGLSTLVTLIVTSDMFRSK